MNTIQGHKQKLQRNEYSQKRYEYAVLLVVVNISANHVITPLKYIFCKGPTHHSNFSMSDYAGPSFLSSNNIQHQYVPRTSIQIILVSAPDGLCVPGQCMNGGTCASVLGLSYCDCAIGFEGQYCEQPRTSKYNICSLIHHVSPYCL